MISFLGYRVSLKKCHDPWAVPFVVVLSKSQFHSSWGNDCNIKGKYINNLTVINRLRLVTLKLIPFKKSYNKENKEKLQPRLSFIF